MKSSTTSTIFEIIQPSKPLGPIVEKGQEIGAERTEEHVNTDHSREKLWHLQGLGLLLSLSVLALLFVGETSCKGWLEDCSVHLPSSALVDSHSDPSFHLVMQHPIDWQSPQSL
ncbi:hypothetical protein VNO77_34340 [Canavalia gladiata]|uniref:Uncharacterized protein n=1 Tax=Canavalia gladiata TaxID=3824 RepID=A0AAN9PZ64_CANGL